MAGGRPDGPSKNPKDNTLPSTRRQIFWYVAYPRMIVVMEPDASDVAVENVISFLVNAGFDVHRSSGATTTILGVVGDLTRNDVTVVSEFPGVSQVVRVSEQFRLASRRFRQAPTVVDGPWGSIGGDKPWIAIEAIGPSGGTSEPPS